MVSALSKVIGVLIASFCLSAQEPGFGSKSDTPDTASEVQMATLKELLPANPFVIRAEKVEEILRVSGMEMEELLSQLMPIARSFARTPISGYNVGEAALGKSGNIYLGINLEFAGLPLNAAVHGEQFLVVNARSHGEREIVMISLPAAPCGHCRQFLNEMDEGESLQILTPNNPPETLAFFLPNAFGPKDLGLKAGLLDQSSECPSFAQESPLTRKALEAAFFSYAPYSRSKSGVAVETMEGKIYTGSYLENAAFNPSLSPLQAALVALVMDLRAYEEIREVILVEQRRALISQEAPTRALLESIAPHAHFKLEKRDF